MHCFPQIQETCHECKVHWNILHSFIYIQPAAHAGDITRPCREEAQTSPSFSSFYPVSSYVDANNSRDGTNDLHSQLYHYNAFFISTLAAINQGSTCNNLIVVKIESTLVTQLFFFFIEAFT